MDFMDNFTESEKIMLVYFWCFLSAFIIPFILLIAVVAFIITLLSFIVSNHDFLLIFVTNHKFIISGIFFALSISYIVIINIKEWEKIKILTLLWFITSITLGAGLGSFVFSFLLQKMLVDFR